MKLYNFGLAVFIAEGKGKAPGFLKISARLRRRCNGCGYKHHAKVAAVKQNTAVGIFHRVAQYLAGAACKGIKNVRVIKVKFVFTTANPAAAILGKIAQRFFHIAFDKIGF